MNTKLLLKVRGAILAEPEKFRMEWWFQEEPKSPCGTSACIAGHVLAISRNWKTLKRGVKFYKQSEHPDYDKENEITDEIRSIAVRELGLSDYDHNIDNLFVSTVWPYEFRDRYHNARTAKQRAKVAADRIDHFIATEGRE